MAESIKKVTEETSSGEKVKSALSSTINKAKQYESVDLSANKNKYNDTAGKDQEVINYVSDNGLMIGMGDNTFSPDGNLTRAQMMQTLYAMEGKPSVGKSSFSDVKGDAWYADAVAWAQKEGIVAGHTDGTFRPDDTITREQMAAIMKKYAEYKGKNVSGHTSVKNFDDGKNVSGYAVEAISWGLDAGLMDASLGNVRPKENATRYEFAKMVKAYDETYTKKTYPETVDPKTVATTPEPEGKLGPATYTDGKNIYVSDGTGEKIYPYPGATGVNPDISGTATDGTTVDPGISGTATDTTKAAYEQANKKALEAIKDIKINDDLGPAITSDGKNTYTVDQQGNQKVYPNKEVETLEVKEPVPEVKSKYKDVSGDVATAANYVSERNIMVGNGEDKFSPEKTLTRAQLIQTLYAMSGKPYTGENNTFKDVNDSKWYGDAITWAQNTGLIAGYTDGTFRPDQAVTKEEMTAILKQYATLSGKNTTGFNVESISGFKDADSGSKYAKDSLAWAQDKGIINETGSKLNPKEDVTRGDLALALMAYDKEYNGGTGKTTGMKAAKTNPVKKVDDAKILNSINARYNTLPRRPYNNLCGGLVCDQLVAQGLIGEDDFHSMGCEQARYFARNGKTSKGYKVIGYPMNKNNDKAQFEKMIADNNGSVDNVVISLAAYSGVGDPEYHNRGAAGHVILISKIEGGNVYFIDNSALTHKQATKMSISEFEQKVFDRYGDGCYMSVITNQKV